MHKKKIGNLGELKVAAYLSELGYSIFKELGDSSKIDLIAEKQGKLLRIQVKAVTIKNGVYSITSTKSGPGYKYFYKKEDIDVFAIYCIQHNSVAWINSHEMNNGASINLRVDKTKNKQTKKVSLLNNFLNFNRVNTFAV